MGKGAYEFLSEIVNEGRYADAASAAHDAWRAQKEGEGWVYGRKRNMKKKEHPLLVPFEKLTEEQKIGNYLSTYSTTNFFRTRFRKASLSELVSIFEDLLAGKRRPLMDELGEYVHSHFTAGRIARSQTLEDFPDMVVYEDLEEDVQELDLVIARATMRYLLTVVSR